VTSGGNNFNNFPENQLAKFRAFYDYKAFQRAKANTNYRMHDLKLPVLTIGVTLNHAFNAHYSVACVIVL